jgi:hypothetical protein
MSREVSSEAYEGATVVGVFADTGLRFEEKYNFAGASPLFTFLPARIKLLLRLLQR